jgi:dTDP-3,4-didehydro-2,6-dideoxy-alpha-D-glucose 3-reductase
MMRFAVVGCGNIAKRSAIPALLKSGVSSVVVCVDTNPAVEKDIKEKFDLPFETDIQVALEKYQFDAVYISTPVSIHKNIIHQVATYHKHILCEKSLAINYEEALEIASIARNYEIAIFEGFMYQFHFQHAMVKNLIEAGEIGTPFHFQAWFGFPPIASTDFRYKKSLGGGAVLDAGSYTVHSARHFFNQEPKEIFAILENETHEVEIRGTVMLNFANSKTAHLVFGFNNKYQNKYIIWGTNGTITLDRAFGVPSDYQSTLTIEKQDLKREIVMPICDHFVEEIKYFVKYVDNKEIKEQWILEFVSQSKTLSQIKNS